MCRNITTLRGLEPPPTEVEVEAAARQYVRKVSGVQSTSAATEEAFERAVAVVARGHCRTARRAAGPTAAPTDPAPPPPKGRGRYRLTGVGAVGQRTALAQPNCSKRRMSQADGSIMPRRAP